MPNSRTVVLVESEDGVESIGLHIPLKEGVRIAGAAFGHNPVAVLGVANDWFKREHFGSWTSGPAVFVFENGVTGDLRLGSAGEYVALGGEYPIGVVYGIDVMGTVRSVDFAASPFHSVASIAGFLMQELPELKRSILIRMLGLVD